MLVNPANTDDLDTLEALVYDLRDLYSIAPSPAATKADPESEEDEEDEESGDGSDDSDDDSEKDSDESGDEDDEDEDDKASTAKLIKDLREENKARRLRLRSVTKERDALKTENARLKRQGKGTTRKKADDVDEDEDEQDDPTKLNPREEAAEIKSALVDVMSDLDLGKKYRRIIAALVDPDEIEIEVSDTGKATVSGLKEAVEELLEDYPEWQEKADDSDDEGDGKTRRISSGNRKKKTTSNGLDRASLAKKFPALASR